MSHFPSICPLSLTLYFHIESHTNSCPSFSRHPSTHSSLHDPSWSELQTTVFPVQILFSILVPDFFSCVSFQKPSRSDKSGVFGRNYLFRFQRNVNVIILYKNLYCIYIFILYINNINVNNIIYIYFALLDFFVSHGAVRSTIIFCIKEAPNS